MGGFFGGSKGKQVATGTYTGDGTNNRDIPVGFTPSLVILFGAATGNILWICWSGTNSVSITTAVNAPGTGMFLTSTGFQVDGGANTANENTKAYTWWAIEA
jgi:hypothetical protein